MHHLILDWSFWTVIVALLAVVLSQLPPIYQLVLRAKLTADVYSRISVFQKVGNPSLQLHLVLTNIGGRGVRIKGIALKLRRDGKDLSVLPAQGYLQEPNDKNAVLFVGFRLKSKEEWGHIVNFFNPFSRIDEKKYRAAETELKNDIVSKRNLPENKDCLVEADAKNISVFNQIFDEKFLWSPGEYELAVSVQSSDKKVTVERKFRFTLFESDSEELSKGKADFKYGDGIFWESGKHVGVVVPVNEV